MGTELKKHLRLNVDKASINREALIAQKNMGIESNYINLAQPPVLDINQLVPNATFWYFLL